MNYTEGFECLGHSNWTNSSPLSPFCSGNFQFVTSLYWEANSYYPRGLILRKGSFANSRNGLDRGDFSAWSIQTGPLAALEATFVLKFFQLSHFHTGGQFLLPQRANYGKREFSQLPIWMRLRGFSAWDTQTGPFATLSSLLCSEF